MVSCGNSIVQNFLFGRNEAIEDMCPPSCETDSFFVDSVMVNSQVVEFGGRSCLSQKFMFQYRDQNQAARDIIKTRNNLTEQEKIYIFEVELKTSEVEMNIEMESYPWSEMLR